MSIGWNMRLWPALLALALAACVDRSQYLELAGGGFIFNYRTAEAIYGVVLVARREPPEGAIIEVSFQNPAGGDPIVLSGPARGGGRIGFQTPGLSGIKKGRPYRVVVVLRSTDGLELQRIEKDFVSALDQSVLPERPLAIGPGYQPNIDRSESAYPPSINRRPPDSLR